jgi:hypothetical protein
MTEIDVREFYRHFTRLHQRLVTIEEKLDSLLRQKDESHAETPEAGTEKQPHQEVDTPDIDEAEGLC